MSTTPELITVTCVSCRKPFTYERPRHVGRLRRTCSEDCRRDHFNRQRGERAAAVKEAERAAEVERFEAAVNARALSLFIEARSAAPAA